MREQGKTKRRGDARISWPKFPSLGKGRKSRFTRSHSSSEADEQRKLELSPTTSDTESPIKSQDALKGKKRHKIKLSVLTKRGRISSSEEQDTDAPLTGMAIGLESPSAEPHMGYVTEEPKEGETSDVGDEFHKVELITIDSTLKTEDLTAALAGQESPSDGKKKKKKERSELKMRIMGKDKARKEDAKAKSSPKRLKTLGASTEQTDPPVNEKSAVIPSFESETEGQITLDAKTQVYDSETKASSARQREIKLPQVEHDLPDVEFIHESPQKGKAKTKKQTDTKQKPITKSSPTFKLPKLGFTDVTTEETIQKMDVNIEESKIKQLPTESTEVIEDPYDRLSKSSISKAQLPKREEIEIPGMEDAFMQNKTQAVKKPKAAFTGQAEEIQAETVQLSIDVDSVKEAVSKLPGFKLPKVDMSGVPIPEEITVIDANAQRISVKTPTKVVDTKTKHEVQLTKIDITDYPEISKTSVKLPKIKDADFCSQEVITETKLDVDKAKKEYEVKTNQGDKEIKIELNKREYIVIPGKESTEEESAATLSSKDSDEKSKKAKLTMPNFGITKPDIKFPDIGIDWPKQTLSEQNVKEERSQIGGVEFDVKIPENESSVVTSEIKVEAPIEIHSIDDSSAKTDADFRLKLHATDKDQETQSETKDVDIEEQRSRFKLPKIGLSLPKVKGPEISLGTNEDVAMLEGKPEIQLPADELKQSLGEAEIKVPEIKAEISVQDKKVLDFESSDSKFQLPTIKLPKFGSTTTNTGTDLSDADKDKKIDGVKIKTTEDGTTINTAESTFDVPSIDKKSNKPEAEKKGSKFKMPNINISMPKVKAPELSLSKKKADTEMKAEGPEIDVNLGKVDVSFPETKLDAEKPELEIKPLQADDETDGGGGKFKMPKFGVSLPKIDSSLSKKDMDITPSKAKPEVKHSDVEIKQSSAKVEVKAPEIEIQTQKSEGSALKFKMPTFKRSKSKSGGVSVEVPDMYKEIKIDGAEVKVPKEQTTIDVATPNIDIEGPSLDATLTGSEDEGKGGKFKMPTFGVSLLKVNAPEMDLSLSKTKVGVTLPEAKDEEQFPEAPDIDVSLKKVDVSVPEEKVEVDIKPVQTEVDTDGKAGKFKMSKFAVSMPKVKTPEIDFTISKKDAEATLPEAEAKVQLPDVELKEPCAKVEVKAPEIEADVEGSPSKFKMPTFRMPKFGRTPPNVIVEVPDVDKNIKFSEAELKKGDADDITTSGIDIEGPSLDVKTTGAELQGKGMKFKMPKLGVSLPKVKGPETDLSLSKKDVDVTLPQVKAEVKLPDAEPDIKIEAKLPEIAVHQKDTDGSPSKFKMPAFKLPKFGVTAPTVTAEVSEIDTQVKIDETEMKAEVEEPMIDVSAPSIDIEGPLVDVETTGRELEGKGSKFKMPSLSFSMPKVKGPKIDLSLPKKDVDVTLPEAKAEVEFPDAPDVDVSLGKVDVSIPEANLEVKKPELDIKPQQIETELDGQGRTFKMPKLGVSLPKVKGPEIDLSLSKKDIDATLPEAKAEVQLPDVEIKEPSATVDVKAPAKDVDGSPSKFKMPTFKLPKFGGGIPSVTAKVPEMEKEIKIGEAQPKTPKDGVAFDSAAPGIDIEGPSVDVKTTEAEGKGMKFKMPKLGVSLPKVQGLETDLSLSKKDVDVTLPEGKAEVKLPDVELEEPSALDKKAPEIKVAVKDFEESPSKFKMPSFKLPKFGVGTSNVTVEVPDMDKHITTDEADIKNAEIEPTVDISAPSMEFEGPSIDVKTTGKELEGKGSKFKMPSLGFSMPKAKGPKIDLSLSKKEMNVQLPEAKAEVTLPEVSDADVHLGKVDVSIPEEKLEIKKPKLDIKPLQSEDELDGQEGKFKMPKLGASLPKLKGPEIDLHLSKTDVDVKLPEVKADVQLPDVEMKEPSAEVQIKAPEIDVQTHKSEGTSLKFKMPTFKLPKFGADTPNVKVEVPDMDKDIKIDEEELKTLKEGPTVDIATSNIDVEGPSVDVTVTGTEDEGKGGKFKLPKFGVSLPKVKGPEINLSLSKKDADVTLPEADVTVQEANVEVKKPKLDTKPLQTEAELDGQGGKFKMPKFGMSLPKVKGPEIDLSFSKKDAEMKLPEAKAEVPDIDKHVKVDGAELKVPKEGATIDITAPSTDIEGPSLDMKITGTEGEGKGSKFKLPKFGVSLPKVKGPEIDLSMSKKDIDVTLPKEKAEIDLLEAPDTAVSLGKVDVSILEAKLEVKKPEVDIKPPQTEVDGQGSKFKMPKFGMSLPKVKGPEVEFGVQKDTNITVGDTKAEVQLPEVEVKEPSDVEVKKSRFSLPKFSFSKPSVQGPEVEASLPNVNVSIPGGNVEVKEAEAKPPETEVETDGHGIKFKMPKFGITMPKVKGPETDLSLSKKEVDATLPEAKAEIKLPDVELKEPSAKVEIKAPEIEAQTTNVEVSPSKFKMPTFKLPKFGAATPNVSVEVPEIEKDIKVDGAELKIPKEGAPSIGIEGPSVDVKTGDISIDGSSAVEFDAKIKKPKFSLPKFSFSKSSTKEAQAEEVDVSLPEGKVEVKQPEVKLNVELREPKVDVKPLESEVEIDGQGSKLKMPKLGIALPKGPEIDLSKKNVDVTLPEAKAEVQLPDVKVKEPVAKAEIKAPEIGIQVKPAEGSPSRFKMPTFKLPKFGAATPTVSVEAPAKDIELEGAELKIPTEEVAVDISAHSIDAEGELLDMKAKGDELGGTGTPTVEADVKLKKTSWTLPKFSFSKTSAKAPDAEVSLETPQVDVSLPEVKAEVHLPDAEIKEPVGAVSAEDAPDAEIDVSLKKPRFSLPKFSFSKSNVTEPEVSVDPPHVDVSLPEGKVEVKEPEVQIKGPEVDAEHDGQGSKFKLPKFGISLQRVKGPEIDLRSSQKDEDVTLKGGEVQLPDAEVKESSTNVEIKASETEVKVKDVGGSPLKFKMPTFKMPKFGGATPDVTIEVPETDKETDGAKLREGAAGSITAPKIDVEGPSIDVKSAGDEKEKGSKFKMPSIGISMQKVKGPELDSSSSKKDVNVTVPEVQGEVKPSGVDPPDAPTVETDDKLKKSSWTLPKFSFSKTSAKAPDDVTLEPAAVEVTLPEAKAEVDLTDVGVKESSPSISMQETPPVDTDAKLKKTKFSLPKFSFSRSSTNEPEVNPTAVDVSLPEGTVKDKQPEVEMQSPENVSLLKKDEDVTIPELKAEVKLPDIEIKGTIPVPEVTTKEDDDKPKKSRFSLFSFSRSVKECEANINLPKVDKTLPEGKVQVKPAEAETKDTESEVQLKEAEGSPLKFKMPTLPSFGTTSPNVSGAVDVPEVDSSLHVTGSELNIPKEDVTLNIKYPSAETDVSKDSETPKIETDVVAHGSPSKFKLLSFKMPKLSFSKSKPEDEQVSVETESKHDQHEVEAEVQPQEASKSPNLTLTTFGEFLKSFDVEFDVPQRAEAAQNLETSTDVHGTDEINGVPTVDTQPAQKEDEKETDTHKKDGKEINIKQDQVKSPERSGWFRFPRFGLSSPSEPAKIPEKEEQEGEKSPVTIKYSDPNAAMGPAEMHSNIITSTARTEMISTEPNLPEKIILSSGVSSSSEDTLKLESGKIHIITSNIQAIPESQHAKLVTPVHVQAATGLPLKEEGEEVASWTVEESQSGRKTQIFERQIVEKTSSENTETIVVTKKITHIYSVDSSEPISDETATSIQRLRDSVHTEKMKFFDGAENSGGRRASCSETPAQPAYKHRMTEVMNSLEQGTEDFGGGGTGGDQGAQIFPDSHERYPKLSKRLPSIVVEPTDAAEVESGELRWPPDEPSSPDAQSERKIEQTAGEEQSDLGVAESSQEASGVTGAEMQDSN
ncbi:hypothetical protein LDENG_00143000 [Lucifuga dentata]|nr:hypothetical protein LDENG_00143000 [Lucifuga dentata]